LFILSEEEEVPPSPPVEPGVIYFPVTQSLKITTKVYYTSSGGGDLAVEKKQLEPFLAQLVGE
jgi:hypothetical protein